MRAAVAATLAVAALAAGAPAAFAHARVVRTEPPAGAVLADAPARVLVVFDEPVASAGEAVLAGGGRELRLPATLLRGGTAVVVALPSGLADGGYGLRWRIVSNDGHVETGTVGFGVGAAAAPPSASASAQTRTDVPLAAARWLLLAGLLAAAGIAALRPLLAAAVPERARPRERRIAAVALTGALALAAAGALAQLARVPADGTRFGTVTTVVAAVAGAGAIVAALATRVPALLPAASAAAVALVPLPALAGHALSPGRPVALALPADVVHTAAAAGWTGGLLWLGAVAWGAGAPLLPAARRFARVAVWLLVALAASGVARAAAELGSPGEAIETGYGQLLLAKSALLALLVVAAATSRRAARGAGERLRRRVGVELALLALVVAAVAGLGTAAPPSSLAGAATAGTAPAVALARQAEELAVALRVSGEELRVTVLGQDGGGASGLDVALSSGGASVEARACGPGCYRAELEPARAVRVRLVRPGGRASTVAFALPRDPRPARAAALVRGAESAIARLRTVTIHERLASAPEHVLVTRYRVQAPDRLAYESDRGGDAVVVGARRWDREAPGEPWRESSQQRLRLPAPDWSRAVDAAVLGAARVDGVPAVRVAFRDPSVPAWFEVALDRRTRLPLRVRMIAAAHFMDRDYGGFDEPLEIRPPQAG